MLTPAAFPSRRRACAAQSLLLQLLPPCALALAAAAISPPPQPALPLGITVCHGWESNPPGGNGGRADNYYAGANATEPLPELKLPVDVQALMQEALDNIVPWFEQTYPPDFQDVEWTSYNFYGASGRALLFLRLHEKLGDPALLQQAVAYSEGALKQTVADPNRIGFLMGLPGIQSVAALAYARAGQEDASQEMIAKLQATFEAVAQRDLPLLGSSTPFQFAWGIAGLLYCELFLRVHMEKQVITTEAVAAAANKLYGIGIQTQNMTSGDMNFRTGKDEFGAGPGSSGAVLMLMNYLPLLDDPEAPKRLEAAMDYYVSKQFDDGGMPTDSPDRIQWCHGAPGFIGIFMKAYQTFGKSRYLVAAQRAANFSEINGVILKGNMLGHGVGGNAYLVMSLYAATKDEVWLRKGLGMQLVALNNTQLTESFSCVPGSMWVDGPGGMAYMFTDLLTYKDDLSQMGTLPAAMPAFGEALWDYGYVPISLESSTHKLPEPLRDN